MDGKILLDAEIERLNNRSDFPPQLDKDEHYILNLYLSDFEKVPEYFRFIEYIFQMTKTLNYESILSGIDLKFANQTGGGKGIVKGFLYKKPPILEFAYLFGVHLPDDSVKLLLGYSSGNLDLARTFVSQLSNGDFFSPDFLKDISLERIVSKKPEGFEEYTTEELKKNGANIVAHILRNIRYHHLFVDKNFETV